MKRARSRPVPSRPGFTLLELAAALALTGLVLAGAWRLVNQLGDERDRFGHARARAFASANGMRLLRDIVAQAEVHPDSTGQFDGSDNAATFDSWCAAPGGWSERCRVTVSVINSGDSSLATVTQSGRATVTAWLRIGEAGRIADEARLLYGDDVVGLLVWRRSWGRTIRAPAALAIARGGDTIVLVIGAP